MSSRLQRQAPTEALLHRDHLNIRFPYQNEIIPNKNEIFPYQNEIFPYQNEIFLYQNEIVQYQNENFPTNYHHKKQAHKKNDDVIALQVKQTNTANKNSNKTFTNKWLNKQSNNLTNKHI